MKKGNYKVCSNCVMDTTDSKIVFDSNGMCDHCHNFYENIKPNWHPNEDSLEELNQIVNKIKSKGKNKKYDCIIGLSGGVDSSYLVYYAVKKLGLRPLVFSCDTGWNLDIANENVKKIITNLKLELHMQTVDWEEMKDLQIAFLKSQVPYQDTPQDHVIFASLYNYAVKNGIKYVLTGGNNSTECVREPYEWVYLNDLRLLKDIHKKYGKVPLKTLPMCGMFKYRVFYKYFKGMKIIRPLDYIPYTKEIAINTLKEEFDWQPYANKHFENIFTRFYEGYWLIHKFGFDKRRAHFSSLILTGQLNRDEALKILENEPYDEKNALEDMEFIANKLGMTKKEFVEIMNGENKTYMDYKNISFISKFAIKFAQLIGMEKRNFR